MYDWLKRSNIDLEAGTVPTDLLPEAKSIIVLVDSYFKEAYPPILEKHFGRCYLCDDRILRKKSVKRITEFVKFLAANGINCKFSNNLNDRIPAARAGLGTFGRNCLFYSRKATFQSSFTSPITILVDQEFESDESSLAIGCPDWCKNACINACPTQALKSHKWSYIDPSRCVSYLTYTPDVITPRELREPMGLYVYGCDRCQNVCPRNRPMLAKGTTLPMNKDIEAMVEDFDLVKLLHMDEKYFTEKIWIHMFYIPPKDLWRWKMNVARVMGNTLEQKYIPELKKAFLLNQDERIKGMIAWALGRIGGEESRKILNEFLSKSSGTVKEEIEYSLKTI
jgi:epoxyqueuosine reductase